MHTFLKIAFVGLYVVGSALSLGGCNTTEGFGKDVKNTGKDIEEKAKESK